MDKGTVTPRYFIQCGKCEVEAMIGEMGASKVAAAARALGFTKTHSLGWICSDCAALIIESRVVATVKKFYVYTLAYPGGKVFYVGKGQGNRVMNHEREAASKCKCYKCRTIRKIWRGQQEIERAIVFETEDESEAYDREIALIAKYGRENLCNCTDGGLAIGKYELTRMKKDFGIEKGTTYQAKDGRWFILLTLSSENGKRVRKGFSGKTSEEAAEKMRKWQQGNKTKTL